MLNGKEEWPVDANLDRFRFVQVGGGPHHDNGSRGGCFCSLLINLDEGFVKNVGDVEIVIRLAAALSR